MSSTPQKFELKPLIYSYFDLVANEEPITNDKAWTTWQCKSQWCKKKVAIKGSTNSNLRTHLNSAKHKEEREDYEKKSSEQSKSSTKQQPKRLRLENNAPESPSRAKNLFTLGVSYNTTSTPTNYFTIRQSIEYIIS